MNNAIYSASILVGSVIVIRRAATLLLNRMVWLSMILLLAGLSLPAQAQKGEWVWMGGSQTSNQHGVYGTLGTPAAGNIPGSRTSSASWTDSSGKFWLFGGGGLDSVGTDGNLNDLWEFNPATNEWAWMGGSKTADHPGVYGTLGTPAAGNIPGSRYGASSWTDSSGNLWLFGGGGIDAKGIVGELNDLWKFDPSAKEWTWMGGSNTQDPPGVYGTLRVPAAGNVPGGRSNASSWTDSSGNFWLFGGLGFVATGNIVYLNDLWEFNPSTNEWAWMGGSNTGNQPGVYGMLRTPAAGNIPGGRYGASGWTDSSGHSWLFGGYGKGSGGGYGPLNDLWEFNASTNEWAWMGGSKTILQPGVYGTLGTPAAGNVPGCRERAAAWTDSSGNLWLLGGLGRIDTNDGDLNDLWTFYPSTNEWAWMGGSKTITQPGVYGTLGAPDPGNTPGSRWSASSWTGNSGNLWLFGAARTVGVIGTEFLNDLWEFLPDANPPLAATPAFSELSGTYTTWQTVSITDTMPGAVIYYTLDGSAPTTSSAKYSTALTISQTTTVKAVAVVYGYAISSVASATYTLNMPTAEAPVFTPPAGAYTSPQSVHLSSTTPGAVIYYTLDGSTPATASAKYSAALTVSNTAAVIKAIAVAYGYSSSPVAGATYTIRTAAPTFSLARGQYLTPRSLTISDATPGATIYYTTDGRSPLLASIPYTGPIAINSNVTIRAAAVHSVYGNSPFTSAQYQIKTAAPTFSLASGQYLMPQSLTISDATPGTRIYYTTNGSTPSASSTPYTGAIAIDKNVTIRAAAVLSGYNNSPFTSAQYTIKAPAPVIAPGTGVYATPQQVTITDSLAEAAIYYTTDGTRPTTSSTPYTGKITVSGNQTIRAIAAATGYAPSPLTYANYAYAIR